MFWGYGFSWGGMLLMMLGSVPLDCIAGSTRLGAYQLAYKEIERNGSTLYGYYAIRSHGFRDPPTTLRAWRDRCGHLRSDARASRRFASCSVRESAHCRCSLGMQARSLSF